jgi:hypothetical protein
MIPLRTSIRTHNPGLKAYQRFRREVKALAIRSEEVYHYHQVLAKSLILTRWFACEESTGHLFQEQPSVIH